VQEYGVKMLVAKMEALRAYYWFFEVSIPDPILPAETAGSTSGDCD
jgi:hypothetical protein